MALGLPFDPVQRSEEAERRVMRGEGRLKRILREKGVRAELELECLETYPFVLENLRKRGISRREK